MTYYALLIALFLANFISTWIFILAHPEVLAGVVILLALAISAYLLALAVERPCFQRIAPFFARDRAQRALGIFGLLGLGLIPLLVAIVVSCK